MKVPGDLKNVYVWKQARMQLPYLANMMMTEGKKGRKYEQVTLGDAASMAIMEAMERRGFLIDQMVGENVKGAKAIPIVASARVTK